MAIEVREIIGVPVVESEPTVEEQIRTALDRDDFREWLASHKETDFAGTCKQPGACPLARYLLDSADLFVVSVQPGTVEWRKDGEWHDVPLPKWASSFVDKVDSRLPWADLDGRLTYWHCLQLLDSIS